MTFSISVGTILTFIWWIIKNRRDLVKELKKKKTYSKKMVRYLVKYYEIKKKMLIAQLKADLKKMITKDTIVKDLGLDDVVKRYL